MATILQLLGISTGASVLLQRYAPHYSVGIVLSTISVFFALFTINQAWKIIVYPRFFSPLRHLPTPSDGSLWTGHTRQIMIEPTGTPHRNWVETLPNDGLIRYINWFEERIIPTTPKALSEVLVTKNYDFIKPPTLRNGLGRILGIGILLAEGDEHKTQRKNLMPAFAYRHVKELYPVFWSKARELTECLAKASNSEALPPEVSGASVQDEEKAVSDVPQHAPGAIEVGNWTSRAGQCFRVGSRVNAVTNIIFSAGHYRSCRHESGLQLAPG